MDRTPASLRRSTTRLFAALGPPCALALLLAVGGCGRGGGQESAPPAGQAADQAPDQAAAPEEVHVAEDGRVAMTVDGTGFHPNRIVAPAGRDLVLAITRTTEQTCGTEIVIPSLSIRQDLPLDKTVEVRIPAPRKGDIAFACGMDMLKGTIVVE